jgi:uncharacterized repeat protein (TIGR03803 family)
MFLSSWLRNWNCSLERRLALRHRLRQRSLSHPPTHIRPCLEALEDRLAPAGFETLYSFTGASDGLNPQGDVIVDNSGNLYGTAQAGGANGGGTVFKFNLSSNTLTVLNNFSPSVGGDPKDALIRDSKGNFYGTASLGGSGGQGTVFQLSSDGSTFNVLHSFSGSDGSTPQSSLVMDSNGDLFGTTSGNGTTSLGTVFELSPNGSGGYNFTNLHSFSGGASDGFDPIAGLVIDSKGNLYGTSTQGGTNNDGTVFELSPSGSGGYNYSIIYTFNGSDGRGPVGGLTMDSKGNLYGTTYFGGSSNDGSVYQLSPNGSGGFNLTTLHSFSGSDGAFPEGALVMDSKGNLFSTTIGPVPGSSGTVFELSPNGTNGYSFTTLHSFSGSDGYSPITGLTADSSGNLYGVAPTGGSHNAGTIFELTVAGPSITPSTANLPANAATLIINGSGFDSNAANDSVTFDNGVTGTVASATATSLTVSLSGLSSVTAGTALHASVTVDGASSGSPVQVATIAPVVTSSKANLPANAASLTINGDGFDSNAANDSVSFDDGVTGTVTSATATSLQVNLSGLSSSIAGAALDASVTVDGVSSGSPVQVATVAPVVTSSTANLPVNAANLTISGIGFDKNAANDSVTFDNGVTGKVTSATTTSLIVSLSGVSGLTAGTLLHASVTVDGVSSGNPVQVATIAPVVTSSTANLPANATSLTINGLGFDKNTANDSVAFDNGVTGTISSATATSLVVNLSGLSSLTAGTALDASVTVDGASSGTSVPVATLAPVVTSSTANLPANAVSLTINGGGFDSETANDSVSFDNGVTGTITSATTSSLIVSLSGLSGLTGGTALHASVTVDSISGGSPVQVAIVAPVITSSTANLPVNAASLTINGNGFDSNAANDSVSFDNGVTGKVTSATTSSLIVSLSSFGSLTAGTALDASVTVNGVSSGSPVQVATVAPVITSSTANLPVNATSLTINGSGFDSKAANDSITLDNGVTGTVASATATSLVVNVNDLSGLTAGAALHASVTVDTVSSGNPVQVATIAPVVSPSTANLPTNATSLTIKGSGFDSNAANDNVTFDNGVTGTVVSATAVSLTVHVGGLSNLSAGTALHASVTVNGVSSGSPVQVATLTAAPSSPSSSSSLPGFSTSILPLYQATVTIMIDTAAYYLQSYPSALPMLNALSEEFLGSPLPATADLYALAQSAYGDAQIDIGIIYHSTAAFLINTGAMYLQNNPSVLSRLNALSEQYVGQSLPSMANISPIIFADYGDAIKALGIG